MFLGVDSQAGQCQIFTNTGPLRTGARVQGGLELEEGYFARDLLSVSRSWHL